MRALRARLIAWYVAAIGTLCMIPYLAVILSDVGLDDRRVALTMMALPLGTVIGGPLWSLIADRTGSPRAILLVSTSLAAVAGGLLATARTGGWMAVGLLVYALARSPMYAIADAIVIRALPDGRAGYGAVRLWGSVAFLVAVFGNGWLREVWPRGPMWVAWGFMLATVLAAAALPGLPRVPRPPLGAALAALRAQPALVPLLLAGVLHGVGITTYDSLFSLHIEHLGLSPRVVGQAVAVGVGAEVAVMALSRRLLGDISPQALLVLGVASGIPRWWLIGSLDSATAQVALQLLHGLSFGAYWVAGVTLYAEAAPKGLESSTQALMPASTFGVGYLVSMALAAFALEHVTPATLFRGLTLSSAAATALALVAARRHTR